MATFVLAHGAWSAAWAWKKMRPLLRAAGHEFFSPTYTGLGERGHLASPTVDLQTHVQDVLGVLEFEDLRGVVLIGHSYGGMVATGVAERAAERLRHVVLLDAFVPRDGQCMLDLIPPPARARMLEQARTQGDGWRVPPNPVPPDTAAADLPWIEPRRMMHPLKAFEQPLRVTNPVAAALPRTYVYCTRSGPGDVFRPFADRARREPGWQCLDLDASHNPHITIPDTLARLLDGIAAS